VIVETLRLTLAGYLLALAMSACLGVHRPLLAAPARAAYTLIRLAVIAATFGKVRLAPLAKRAKRTQRRRLRQLRFELAERREAWLERRGKLTTTAGVWSSGDDDR
jgi:hypothetical protein